MLYQQEMDIEARTMIDMMYNGAWGKMTSDELALIEWRIRDRLAMIGAGARKTPSHWNRSLAEIDPQLRIRWDFSKGCWCVERWVWQWKSWSPLKYWMDDSGPLNMDIPWLCRILRKNDMQANPHHWQQRREEAALIRQGHDKRNTAKVIGAVESLSKAQVKEFIAVEQSVHTGEKITHHGPDLAFVERQYKASRTSPALPSGHSINPGCHPKHYRRDYKRRADLGL